MPAYTLGDQREFGTAIDFLELVMNDAGRVLETRELETHVAIRRIEFEDITDDGRVFAVFRNYRAANLQSVRVLHVLLKKNGNTVSSRVSSAHTRWARESSRGYRFSRRRRPP